MTDYPASKKDKKLRNIVYAAIVVGLIIVFAVLIDVWRKKKR